MFGFTRTIIREVESLMQKQRQYTQRSHNQIIQKINNVKNNFDQQFLKIEDKIAAQKGSQEMFMKDIKHENRELKGML